MTIYEARDGLTARLQDSYPIGLNPRGAQALDRANPDLALAIRQRGAMVDAWKIYAGGSVGWAGLSSGAGIIIPPSGRPSSVYLSIDSLINQLCIHVVYTHTTTGRRLVAEVQSGLVVGTTRSTIAQTARETCVACCICLWSLEELLRRRRLP